MESNASLIKERKKYFNALSIRVLHLPFLFFSILVVLVLSKEPEPFGEVIKASSSWLLTWIEPAQTWVNVSVVYREKMALIYVLFVLTGIYILISTSLALWKNRKFFTVDFVPPMRIDCKNILPIIFVLFFLCFFIYMAGFSEIYQGSNIWLDSLEHVKQRTGFAWLVSVEAMWNIKWTFLFTRWVQLTVIWSFSIGCLQYFAALRICLNGGK
ncbi:hypothetical protein [Hydrogenovibrio kuenenii]|uniref:hypothetical protein n=1 Tax=Hydrogenovibrio kuenenii TaxID=63658 RepID=UPI000466BC42|nr:hypothetical protein [Hydrogenovibrio kuenenii]